MNKLLEMAEYQRVHTVNVPDIISLRELDQILQSSVRLLRTPSLGVAFGCLQSSLAHPVYNIYIKFESV